MHNENPAMSPTPRGGLVPKVEKYGWILLDKPGVPAEVPKSQLGIDLRYQRERISNNKLLKIAREWSWVACNSLVVGKREDGTLWVIDGQHRKLAADKRGDIDTLPCRIFETIGMTEEAAGFLRCQTVRTSIASTDRFRAMVATGDQMAIETNRMIEGSGFHVSFSRGPTSVGCVMNILTAMKDDRVSAINAWAACIRIASDGSSITDQLFGGLFHLERHLRSIGHPRNSSILDKHNIDDLVASGTNKIKQSIGATRAYFVKGGGRIFAQGIINLLNHRRSARKIPSIIVS